MKLAFDPQLPVVAATSIGEGFPVRRIFCVGRNYAEHAREMGSDPQRDPPFFFTKWAETLIGDGAVLPYPQATRDFHYEVELVVAIGKAGRDIPSSAALDHVWGHAVGLDMTRRDLQSQAKEKGRPWDIGKNVEGSAPLGLLHPGSHFAQGEILLIVNGAVRQRADIGDLIWPVADVISILSQLYKLQPGDLIYTGTPAGVGPVLPGDVIHASVAGLTPLTITIGPVAA